MGTMPTTSAIAGTVSGSRQMNSTTRLRPGNLSLTHTIVGSKRTSIAMQVMAAISSDAVIASVRSGVFTMDPHALRVLSLISRPRVENSSIAAIGTRKNAPSTMNTTALNAWSFSRRVRFISLTQPPSGSPLQQRVQAHHQQHHHDHANRQCLRQTGLGATRLAREQVGDNERDDHAAAGDQGGRGRIGREGVGEQQQGAAEERGCQERARDVTPVVPTAAAEALRSLAPLRPDAI